jgi:ATP-dependent Clp protease adapter protein ClpS
MPYTENDTLLIPGEAVWERMSYGSDINGPYIVIVYNDNWHSFPDVIVQLQKATGCTFRKAHDLSHAIDTHGRAVVYSGSQPDCEWVAGVLREIRLQVETDRVS